jgi:hypothetical protein
MRRIRTGVPKAVLPVPRHSRLAPPATIRTPHASQLRNSVQPRSGAGANVANRADSTAGAGERDARLTTDFFWRPVRARGQVASREQLVCKHAPRGHAARCRCQVPRDMHRTRASLRCLASYTRSASTGAHVPCVRKRRGQLCNFVLTAGWMPGLCQDGTHTPGMGYLAVR